MGRSSLVSKYYGNLLLGRYIKTFCLIPRTSQLDFIKFQQRACHEYDVARKITGSYELPAH